MDACPPGTGKAHDKASTPAKFRGELHGALIETRERETAVELGTRAQIAIDILIRNLFERTADVGFLAEDGAIKRENVWVDLAAILQQLPPS